VGERVVIERRFRGPPNSAQGGYTCGLVGQRIEGPAEVALRAPPPLETPLELRREDDGVSLVDGEVVVAQGRAVPFQLDVPRPPAMAEAQAASAACPWLERHPFPTCFGCGPDRDPADALRLLLGPVAGRDLFATVWTPHPSLAGEDGAVRPVFMWAALDCPTAGPAVPLDGGPSVLARMRARIEVPARARRPHTVTAWLVGHDGRRHYGGAAIHDEAGRLCGVSEGLWIELRDPASMGARV
jgi:hypothetical protein